MPAFHVHVAGPDGRHIVRIEAGSPTDARLRAKAPDRLVLKVKIARADKTARGARLTRKALQRQKPAKESS